MKTIREKMVIVFGVSHPKWLLEIGAKIIGTETELVLKSRNVIPKRLLDSGFAFKYLNIDDALQDLIKN